MRRALLLSFSLVAMTLAGCPSKPKDGECKTSDDCKEQQGFGPVCVNGRCQECGADTDCKAGFVCRDNRCTPRPECVGDVDCGAGRNCQDGKCVAAPAPVEPPPTPEPTPAPVACGGEDQAVRFGFDRADLDATARGTLDGIAGCLKSQRAAAVVEGHCDERGTVEYNLHLGERRAEAVKKYLGNLGVDAKSIKTTSYGKERPLCNERNESCWSRNRRAVVTGG